MYPRFDYFKIKWGTYDESPTLNKKIMKEQDVIIHLDGNPKTKGKLSNQSNDEDGWFVLTDDTHYDGGWNINSFEESYGYMYAWHTGHHGDKFDWLDNAITKIRVKNKLYKL